MAQDKHAIHERAQLGHTLGYGKKPALLVVDFQLGFTAPEQSPLAGNLDAELAATNRLIAAARTKDVPAHLYRCRLRPPPAGRRRSVAAQGAVPASADPGQHAGGA